MRGRLRRAAAGAAVAAAAAAAAVGAAVAAAAVDAAAAAVGAAAAAVGAPVRVDVGLCDAELDRGGVDTDVRRPRTSTQHHKQCHE